MKRLAVVLALLVAIPAFADWKFNPHTGKPDYFESGGPPGPAGDNGVGVPAGGTTGQVLEKIDNTDFNTQWADPPAAGLHAGTHVTGGGDTIANAVPNDNSGLMSGADKAKLDGIAAGAEVNVNADWNAGAGDSQILNKPTIPAAADTVVSEEAYGAADTAGIAATFSRSDHTHGSVPFPSLDNVLNPATDKTFGMGSNRLIFSFTNPTGAAGVFEIEALGAFSGDLLHVHQHTGNPGATNLVHLEAVDPDVVPLHIVAGGSTAISVDKQIASTLATGTAPLVIASTTVVSNLNSDLLDGSSAADFAPAAQGVTNGNSHDHSGGDGAQVAYSSLSGTPSLGTISTHNVGTLTDTKLCTYTIASGFVCNTEPGGAWPGFSDAEGDPAPIGTVADGTSAYPSRRDHVHAGSHTALTNIGTNTHAQIDTHISTGAHVTNGDSHDHSGGDGAQIAYSGLSGLPTLPSNEAGAANNFLTAYNSTTGAFSKAQPTWANIDKATSSIADITTRSHTALTDIGTNAHSVIDTFIASKAAASGLASLSAGSLVVQDPANATATPTASKIPIADGSGYLNGWIQAGSETVSGKAELATDAETVTGTATGVVTTPANVRAAYTPTNIAATPGADHTSTGHTTNALNAGGTITIMDLVILNSSSQWVQTDANAAATYAGMLAISLESKTTGQAMKVALPGSFVRDDTWNWTPGAVLYLSETAGQITSTQPTTTDAAIRIIGYAVSADVIWFMPDGAWITHT